MKLFSELSMEQKNKIAQKFDLPKDGIIYVDEYNRPFLKDGGRFMCRMKPEFIQGSFHLHEMKNI